MPAEKPLSIADQCPPGRDHWEQDEIEITPCNRLLTRMRYWEGRLIGFAVMHMYLNGGEWVEVARADSKHDEAHVHVIPPDGTGTRRVLRPITDAVSVVRGYDECYDWLIDNLETNVTPWLVARR